MFQFNNTKVGNLSCKYFFAWITIFTSFIVNGQNIDQKKADLVFKIAEQTHWNTLDLGDTFRIYVFGNSENIYESLRIMAQKNKLKRRIIEIQQTTQISELENAQIVYLCHDQNDQLLRINRRFGDQQKLIFSENYKDERDVMVNFTGNSVLSLSYSINRISFLQKKMKYTNKITAFGGKEIDLVKLYKNLQNEIIDQNDLLSENESQLNEYNKKIKLSQSEIKKLLVEIKGYKKEIVILKKRINIQSNTISANDQKLIALNKKLDSKEQELDKKLSVLLENEQLAVNLNNAILTSESTLSHQDKQIKAKSERIKQQTAIINSKERTIKGQRKTLLFTGIVILLTSIIAILFIRGRAQAKRSADALQTKNEALSITQDILRISLEKEKKLNEMKSQFISTASHQFRTPMSIIQSNLSLLDLQKQEMSAPIKTKFDKAYNNVRTQISRMTELMDEVLIMGKIESETIKPNLKQVKLDQICDTVVNNHNAIQEDNRTISFTIKNKPRPVLGDKKLLEFALSNIVSNAFKFSQNKPSPQMILTFHENHAEIRVIDFGIGISENALTAIFEPFYRADNALEINGTGLGTTIAQNYIQTNNGQLKYESVVNKKTEAILTLQYI